MINKIICSYLLFSCLIAIALKLGGVDETLHLGTYFRSYIVASNKELMDFKIEIPSIPSIPKLIVISTGTWAGDYLVNFVNGFTTFVNGLITLINIVITVLNTFIQVIELILIFLKNLIIMKNEIISA